MFALHQRSAPLCPGRVLTYSSYPAVSIAEVSLGQLGCSLVFPADSSSHCSPRSVASGLQAMHSCVCLSHCPSPSTRTFFLVSRPLQRLEGVLYRKRRRDVDHQLLILYSLQFCYFHSLKILCSLLGLSQSHEILEILLLALPGSKLHNSKW